MIRSNKIKIVVLMFLAIVIIFIFKSVNSNQILKTVISQTNKEELPLFSYVIYDNQDEDNIKVLITVNSENGIEYIEKPNGEIIYGNKRNKLSIDYKAKKDEKCVFQIKQNNIDKMSEEMVIDNSCIQETSLKINKLTDISGYKVVDIDKRIHKGNYEKIYYKIGENGDWIEGSQFSVFDYDLTQNDLVNDDNTITIFAKVVDDITKYEVIVNERYSVNTNEKIDTIQSNSLLEAIKDSNLENGKYEVTVSDEKYNLKLYNINCSVEMNVDTSMGVEEDVGSAEGYAQNMIVLKVNGDLTIGDNAILTPYKSKTGHGGPKGMLIYCTGTLINNGTISMTARGAYSEGQNVYLWQNADGSYEYVPAEGADGGASVVRTSGISGENGVNRETGGGGSGASGLGKVPSGAGAKGTSYSGGSSGGGAENIDGRGDYWATPASENGGAGGVTRGNYANGVGNPSGGTGGLLILYANNILNNKSINAMGTDGPGTGERAVGGSSGGGSINIFYESKYDNLGDLNANGGKMIRGLWGTRYSGAGGNGTVSVGTFFEGTYIGK